MRPCDSNADASETHSDHLCDRPLGVGGFAEIAWETEAGTFDELGVDAVRPTLILDAARRATWYPGHPGRALEALSP